MKTAKPPGAATFPVSDRFWTATTFPIYQNVVIQIAIVGASIVSGHLLAASDSRSH